MFHLSYTIPAKKVAGIIRVKEPITKLGTVVDVDGTRWDINGLINGRVLACKYSELHPASTYTGTGTFYGMVTNTWKPYDVEVVK